MRRRSAGPNEREKALKKPDAQERRKESKPAPLKQNDRQTFMQAVRLAKRAAGELAAKFPDILDSQARRRLVNAYRRALAPKPAKKRGRKTDHNIDLADQLMAADTPRLEICRRVIPGWSKMQYYRRRAEKQRMENAVHQRRRRRKPEKTSAQKTSGRKRPTAAPSVA